MTHLLDGQKHSPCLLLFKYALLSKHNTTQPPLKTQCNTTLSKIKQYSTLLTRHKTTKHSITQSFQNTMQHTRLKTQNNTAHHTTNVQLIYFTSLNNPVISSEGALYVMMTYYIYR